MIKHVGYPKCVCAKPFTLVHSPAEYRTYTKAKATEENTKPEKQK